MVLTFRQFMAEGNPLARIKANADAGRHFVGITSDRSNLTPAENNARMKELKGKLKAQGYGYRKAKGVWEGGSENSLIVHAKGTGNMHGARLRYDMKKHAQHYDQDAILHHNGKSAKLIGTNSSGYPGKGKKEPVGKLHYNRPDAPFQTKFKKSASFTTGD